MGRVFQHEIGKRHTQNLSNTNRHTDRHRKEEEPVEETPTLEIAPGEPVPPGFEEEVGISSQIEERLNGFKAGPLVALEYLLELQDDDPSKEPVYLCILCDKRGDPRTVLTHLASYNHISQYLQKHFPTSWRALVPYMTKQYKRNWQTTLQKIAEGIETKFGRLKPFPIEKDKFEKDRMYYLQIVGKGRHFSEQSGYTFEELIVHDELTKTHEEEKSYESSATNNWGTTTIQKPFKKKDPSPPVVGVPLVRTRGNAQTNPRKQEPAYVPASQKPLPNTGGKPQIGGKDQGNQPLAAKLGQQRRLSSVSSISSSDLSDNEGSKNRNARRPVKRREPFYKNERNHPHSRNRSQSPRRRQVSPKRRSPPPRRRLPSPRRRSPSPRRTQKNIQVQKQADNKKHEEEMERIRKIEEYRKLARAIENDLQNTLKQHEKNPEKHPQYNEEWKKFWNRRYKELKAIGVDVAKYDFKPEWIEFWNKKMVELHSDELRSRKDALRRRLALPEDINPIKFKISGVPALPEKTSPKRLPMAAQPDQEDEVILIDDQDDDVKPTKRSHSPWEEEPNSRDKAGRIQRSGSPRPKKSRDRSPVRSSRRSRSRERYTNKRSRSRDKSLPRERNLSLRSGKDKELVRERDMRERDAPKSREYERDIRSREFDRDFDNSRESRGKRHSRESSLSRNRRTISPKRSPSGEHVWGKRDIDDRKRTEYRESSFERDIRGRERVRTVADLPWEREKAYRMSMEEYYKPPPIMRDATRKPVMREVILPPEEDDDDIEVNVVDVLRLLTALEERLGSLGPKVIDLLALALAMEKKEANSSESLLDNDINSVLFETVKEKLKGQLLAGLVDIMQERAFKKAIKKTASLVHLAGQRKRQRDKLFPRVTPVSVPGVGTVDKAAIAKQIANALILQGKTDVTQAELEQLINAVVGMAEASKNSSKPVTTANFLEQLSGGNLFTQSTDKIIIPSSDKKKHLVDLDKLTEPLTPSPGKNSVSNMENLSDSDLQTLLQNFKDLSTDEQHNLINYLKKLEYQEPERVERLRKFVNLDPNGRSKDEDSKESTDSKKKGDRESPFSNRLGSLNPEVDDLTKIESDEEDMEDGDKEKYEVIPKENEKSKEKSSGKVNEDSEEEDYTFEDVVKTVSKNVKDKEMAQSKKIVEDSMKFESSKTKPDLEMSSAKDLISNLMSNISRSNSNSGSVDLLGLGVNRSNPNPLTRTPGTLSNSLDLAALSSINMASLTSIVNNVKNMTSVDVSTDHKLNFEPPSPIRNAGKINFNPAHLDKPLLAPDRGPVGTELGLGPRGGNVPGREFDRGPGGPDRGFERHPGGPGRGFERLPGGPERGFERGPERGQGERGPERGFGPDRHFDRDEGGPGHDFERGPMGSDRGFNRNIGQERDFDRGTLGPGFRGSAGFDRPLGGTERIMDRGYDKGPGPTNGRNGQSFQENWDLIGFGGHRAFEGSDRDIGGGINRGIGGGPDRGIGGGPDRGFGGPERPFAGPVGGNRDMMGQRGGSAFGPRDSLPFGNDLPSQRLPKSGMDQRNNPRFGGPDFDRNNFNRW
ncbi:hypothetical protein JTB14_038478 [Gonioctena quinquepunctata]|nr:hypothetical protein JTB14_038478 [Gonioctena quinquepunctata]